MKDAESPTRQEKVLFVPTSKSQRARIFHQHHKRIIMTIEEFKKQVREINDEILVGFKKMASLYMLVQDHPERDSMREFASTSADTLVDNIEAALVPIIYPEDEEVPEEVPEDQLHEKL